MSIKCCGIVKPNYGQSFIPFTSDGVPKAVLKRPEVFDIISANECSIENERGHTNMKKMISILLALCLSVMLVPAVAEEAHGT